MGYIDADDLSRLAEPMKKSTYGCYLLEIAQEELSEGKVPASSAKRSE